MSDREYTLDYSEALSVSSRSSIFLRLPFGFVLTLLPWTSRSWAAFRRRIRELQLVGNRRMIRFFVILSCKFHLLACILPPSSVFLVVVRVATIGFGFAVLSYI